MIDTLLYYPALAAALWGVVYLSDWLMTIYASRLYTDYVRQHAEFEGGYELNPALKKAVAAGRWVSPRFVALLVASVAAIWLIGTMWQAQGLLAAFEFILGAWFLIEAAIHVRHIRNIATFRIHRSAGTVRGFTSYPAWVSYRVSAVEMLAYSGFYALLYLLFWRLFFLGGAVTALVFAIYHAFLGMRARKTSQLSS